jgi:hypothetical protein
MDVATGGTGEKETELIGAIDIDLIIPASASCVLVNLRSQELFPCHGGDVLCPSISFYMPGGIGV